MNFTATLRRGKAAGDAGWGPFDEGIGVGRVGGFLMQVRMQTPPLVVIGRDICEPVSRRDLPSFLSVVVWFASGRSPKSAAAKLVFFPFSTRRGYIMSDSFLCAKDIELGTYTVHFDFKRTTLSTSGRSLS